jgi:hypothetical protein
MADVSVRFQAGRETEIVLNLSVLQAVRLVEAIMGRVADAMSEPGRIGADSPWQDAYTGGQAPAGPPYRPPTPSG